MCVLTFSMLFNVIFLCLRVMGFPLVLQVSPLLIIYTWESAVVLEKNIYAKIKDWNGGYQELRGRGKWGVVNQQA